MYVTKFFDNICTMIVSSESPSVFIYTKFSYIWMVQSQDIGQLVIMGHTQKTRSIIWPIPAKWKKQNKKNNMTKMKDNILDKDNI